MADENLNLTVELAMPEHTLADVRLLVDGLYGIFATGLLVSVLSGEEPLASQLQRLSSSPPRRFHYWMDPFLDPFFPFSTGINVKVFEAMDYTNPFDAVAMDAVRSVVPRILELKDPPLYRQLFSPARVVRLKHDSPLLLELSLVLAGVGAATAAITKACLWVIDDSQAQRRIRKADAEAREQEVEQQRYRTKILQAISEQIARDGLNGVSSELIVAATAVAANPVTSMAKSPLIGTFSVGYSGK